MVIWGRNVYKRLLVKLVSPSAERNREAIADVLLRLFPTGGRVLEVGSGSGQHVALFAERLPHVHWQPTDRDEASLASIEAYRQDSSQTNFKRPERLDILDPGWSEDPRFLDVVGVVAINVIHVAPMETCEMLVTGASRVLPPYGMLVLYGPFRFSGKYSADSNKKFDAELRGQDSSWGVRDVDDITRIASGVGLVKRDVVEMPASNHIIVYQRELPPPPRSSRHLRLGY